METILIAEDDPVQQETLSIILSRKLGYRVIRANNGKEAIDLIYNSDVGEISALLMDIEMPVMNGFDSLKSIRRFRPDLPIIMLTGNEDISVAIRAIKDGANDFIVKPPDPSHLDIAIKNAIKISSLSRELAKLKRDKEGALSFADLVGYNGGLSSAVAYGKKAAISDVPVLIMGETGVGKELFARAIHGESKRVGAPFIAINCGAIPENLVESTLFGHEKGSFTGAISRSIGKFREAEGGTIFLDEIGELPLDAQVKLLRVLQQKEIEPVGAGRAVKINVRVISATNRDMKREVAAGRFREDLYFRLNVLPITVPPLRERHQDILPLAEYFMQLISASDMIPAKTLSQNAKEYLKNRKWTGNVRELENIIHRALVFSDSEFIDASDIEQINENGSTLEITERRSTPELHINLRYPDGKFKPLDEIEAEIIAAALTHFSGNITKTAEALGIAKSTFYRKVKDYNRF